MEKEKYYGKLNVQQSAFHLLVEKIEEHPQGYLNSYCLLIADEQDELEQKLIDDLDHFKQQGTTFGYKNIKVDRVIDSVHFVQSHNNYLMQLADVMCYIIRKSKESNKKLLAQWQEDNKKEKINFNDWKESFGNREQKYF
jgi:DNA polymerase IIIc chi subunit